MFTQIQERKFRLFDPKTEKWTHDYTSLAVRTAAPQERVRDHWLHALVGMNGEFSEMMDHFWPTLINPHVEVPLLKVREELGDVLWYIALAINASHEMFQRQLFPSTAEEYFIVASTHTTPINPTWLDVTNSLFALHVKTAFLADRAKRELFYKKNDPQEPIAATILECIPHLVILLEYYHIDLQQLLQDNVLKLAKRYMGGEWSAEECYNRNIKHELNHIV